MAERLDRGHPAVTNPRRAGWFSPKTLLWLLPLAFLGVFFFLPLGKILLAAMQAALDKGFSLSALSQLTRPLWFTTWQAALSTLLTLLIGLPAAYVFSHYSFAGKRLLRVLTTLPFILPTVVAVAGFTALLGPRGLLNLWLMALLHLTTPPITFMNTLWGILLVHVFYNTTIILRVVGSAWSQLDPRWEQTARVLGASRGQALREVTLPLLRPSILAATLLVFLFDFTSFGVILMVGGPYFATLEVAIYQQTLSLFNLPLAGLLAVTQLICTFIITSIYSRVNGLRRIPLLPSLTAETARPLKTWGERVGVTAMNTLLTLLLVSPMLALAVRSFLRLGADQGERGVFQSGFTLQYYKQLFINSSQSIFYVPPASAALNSLLYAVATVLLSLTLGTLAVYAMFYNQKFRRWLDPLITLPLGASAVTLGLGFILTFTRAPFDARHFPLLIPIAHALVATPFVVRTLQPTLNSIPDSLRQAAGVLGASPLRVWRHVDVPLLKRSALVAAIFAFTISLGEFGATSFLARPENPTLPVAIYRYISMPGELNYGQALAMSTILLVLCGLAIFLLERLQPQGSNEI
jgi:thiamine transport system permease protein